MLVFTENRQRTGLAGSSNPRAQLIAAVIGPTGATGATGATGDVSSLAGLGAGVATFLATPSSANLAAAMTNETGSGALVFATSPLLITPTLGTPSSGTLTSCAGLPIATGVSGLGTGIATFLATPSSANLASAVTDETGSGSLVFATSPTLVTPALGTPSSGTLSSCTNLPVSTGISGLGAGVATFLATPSSANLASAVTDETGTGALIFADSPSLTTKITLTGAQANALAVGRQGATNPVLNVDSSAATVVTGLNLVGAAAAGRMAVAVTSSGTDEGLSIDAKGSGTIRLGATSTGAIEHSRNAVPTANDGAALGTTALGWADLFLATGGVLNWANGTQTFTTTNNADLGSNVSLVARSGTAIPAGGTAGVGLMFSSASNFGIFFGSGAPTLSAAKGSLYLRSDGSTTNDRAYINSNGTTTWTALTTAA